MSKPHNKKLGSHKSRLSVPSFLLKTYDMIEVNNYLVILK